MTRSWDYALMTIVFINIIFAVELWRSPDASMLNLQSHQGEKPCLHESILCDASMDYSYLMKSNPEAAALWRPCRVRLPRNDGIADIPFAEGEQDAFTVRVCASAGEIYLHVTHHELRDCMVPGAATIEEMGLSRTDTAKDYIEVLLDGPERRLRRLDFMSHTVPPKAIDPLIGDCVFTLRLPIYLSGMYRVQIIVVHSDIALTGIEPYRNYVLWDRFHILSAKSLDQISSERKNDGLEAWHSTGIWMRRGGKNVPGHHSAQALVAQKWNDESYRCPADGTASFTWMPYANDLPRETLSYNMRQRSMYMPLNPSEAMACARALAPQHMSTYPKLVLFGDSLMRQTFNAVASAIGMENVTAIKEFKSLMESQNWGGPSIGLDLSFQWAARSNEGRDTRKEASISALLFGLLNVTQDTLILISDHMILIIAVRALLEQGAYVLVNYGAHPLCDGTMLDNLRMFDDWLEFLLDILKNLPVDARGRIAWLGSHARPIMGFHNLCPTP